MEILKLIGIVIVIVGFILKLDTLAVVVVAGVVTGLAVEQIVKGIEAAIAAIGENSENVKSAEGTTH